MLKGVFRKSYGGELIDNIASMTPRMVDERIVALGTTDPTKQRAVGFFVNGAKHLDLDIPATITKRSRTRRSASKPSTAAQRTPDATPDEQKPDATEQHTSTQATATPQIALHDTIVAMLEDLPNRVASWSEEEQDLWLEVFTTNLRYFHPAREEE